MSAATFAAISSLLVAGRLRESVVQEEEKGLRAFVHVPMLSGDEEIAMGVATVSALI